MKLAPPLFAADVYAPFAFGQRAEAIGAALHVSSEAGRTAVEIRLR